MRKAPRIEDTPTGAGVVPSPPNGGFDQGLKVPVERHTELVESTYKIEGAIQ